MLQASTDPNSIGAPTTKALVSDRGWLGWLALPFGLCLILLLATGWVFPVFWGGDELEYWALMRWFAVRLPGLEPIYPHSATAPLFQWLGAWVVLAFGPHIQVLRVCNVLVSVGGVWICFGTLRRSFRHGAPTAALLALVLALSTYFFGYSFRLLTDNLALVLGLLTMGQLYRSLDPLEPHHRVQFLWACLWCGLAVLARQSFLFLGGPFLLALGAADRSLRAKIVDLLVLGVAMLPLAALFVAWRGVVPPGYQVRHASSLFHLYPPTLPLMLLGVYAPFFFGVPLWRRLRAGEVAVHECILPLGSAMVAAGIVFCFQLVPVAGASGPAYFPEMVRLAPPAYFGGWLYTVAQRLPKLHGNSLLFWLLLPLGVGTLATFVWKAFHERDPRFRLNVIFFLSVVAASAINAVSVQKYYDALTLLFLIWLVRGEIAWDLWRRLTLFGLLILFGLYYAAFPFFSGPDRFPSPPPSLSNP